jgi:hypothetical protein
MDVINGDLEEMEVCSEQTLHGREKEKISSIDQC